MKASDPYFMYLPLCMCITVIQSHCYRLHCSIQMTISHVQGNTTFLKSFPIDVKARSDRNARHGRKDLQFIRPTCTFKKLLHTYRYVLT